MRKKLLSMLLTLCMVLTMLPATALALETQLLLIGDGQSYEWTADGLYAAMAAAKTGDTIKLIGGTAGTLSFSNFIIVENKNITLDLNGQTVEYDNSTGGLCGIALYSTAVLTVTDSSTDKKGSFTATSTADRAFNVFGSLTISSGTVGSIRVNNGSLTVNGGKVKAIQSAIYVDSTTATVSITGGEIESTNSNALDICPMYGKAEDTANITITGGSLSAPGTVNPVIYINPGSSNGATNITIHNAQVTATGTNGVALAIYSQKNTTLTIGSGATITGGFGEIMQPSVSTSTVYKEATKQKTVSYTLKNPETYKNPTWKLYTTSTGTTVVSGVSVASVGSTLTLTAAGEDLAGGNYYLAVAADPSQYYVESTRIKLTVNSYVPPDMTGDANIIGTPQVGQTLTLTNNTSGGSTPVWYATDNNTATGGTQFANGVTSVQLEAAQVGKYIFVTVPADASHTGSINSNVVGPVTKVDGPSAPSVSFSFDGANANKLIGATALMEYSLDGGTYWENCTLDMDLTTSLGSITIANDIKVRVKETEDTKEGAVQNIDITQSSAPTIGKTDETSGLNDGTITGVSNLMEYKKSGDIIYTAISGSTVTGLVPREYLVRFKATGTVLASSDATVEIVAFTKKTPTLADLTYSLAAVDYDGSAKPLSVTAVSGKALGAITVKYNGSTTVPTNAGTYAITVDIAGNTQYNAVAGLSLGSYTIEKIAYTGTTDVSASVLVGGQAGSTITLPTLPTGASYGTPTASGAITMTSMSIEDTTLTYTAPVSTAGQTGRMTIPVTGATNYNNYSVFVTVTYTAKTPQVISFANSNIAKTYGNAKFTNPLTQTTVNGTIAYASDDVSVATINADTGEVTILAVGDESATITATAAETTTHAQATASYTVTVAKKALTLKADDKSINKGDGLPTFTYTATGLVDSDAVTSPPTMSTSADGATVGTFDITIAGGVVANATSYDITYTKGTLNVAELLFTTTATNGTGGGSYAEGATVTITANDRSGYTFTGWSCVDVTFANATAKTTTFTMPAKAVTVTANYHKISSGGSGGGGSSDNSSPVIGTIDITDKTVTDAFEKALAEAKKNGNEQNGITVVLPVDTGSKTGSNVRINLPKTVQDIIIAKKIVNTIVVVDNPDIRIGMDLTTVKEINRQANSDVNIIATRKESSELTGDANKAIGSRPVFDLKVNYGSGKQVQSFGPGRVSVTIPYALGTNEKAENLQAVYVDGNGKVHWLVSSVYDSVNKVLRFSTSHFSTYGVGYKQDAPSFTDIANHYRKDDIEFIAARGLLEGTGTTTFEPDRAITRGMLITALGRMANANVGVYTKSSFTDVKNDAYYMGYVEWASNMSIISGIDGKFSPDMAVTREHMAVILSNYAKAMGITLEKVYEEVTFADKSKVSDYAKESVKEMQMAGIITNKSNNLFDPAGTATRSEVSAVLRRFIERTTGSSIPQGWIMNDSGKWMYYEKGKAVTGKKEISGLIYEFNQYGETASSPGNPVKSTDKEQKEEKKEEKPKNTSTPKPVVYKTYRVKKGDSFWKISQIYKCSMYELAKLNNKTIKDIIYLGEVLKIPRK